MPTVRQFATGCMGLGWSFCWRALNFHRRQRQRRDPTLPAHSTILTYMSVSLRWISIVGLTCCACAAGADDGPRAAQQAAAAKHHASAPGNTGTFNNATSKAGSSDASLPAPPNCGNGERTRDEPATTATPRTATAAAPTARASRPATRASRRASRVARLRAAATAWSAPSEACDDGTHDRRRRLLRALQDRARLRVRRRAEHVPADEVRRRRARRHRGLRRRQQAAVRRLPAPRVRPSPRATAAGCTSSCGDGLVLNEDCDDGNAKNGDGCSKDCKVEPGFTCSTDTPCEMQDGHCILRVPAIFRDFNESHPDFQVGCGTLTPGVVQDTLNADGKPVLKDGSAGVHPVGRHVRAVVHGQRSERDDSSASSRSTTTARAASSTVTARTANSSPDR